MKALSKFAGCLGAAACSWLIASAIVLPAILVTRAKIKRARSSGVDRVYGEFTILGEDGHSHIEEGHSNGRETQRIPITSYVRLGEPGEMHALNRSQIDPRTIM